MGMPGGFELVIIFLVVLLVFGAKRIPEIARGVGKGIREFKDATSEIKREINVDEKRNLQSPRQGTPTPRAESTPQAQTGTQEQAQPSSSGSSAQQQEPQQSS